MFIRLGAALGGTLAAALIFHSGVKPDPELVGLGWTLIASGAAIGALSGLFVDVRA